ncbi:cob(I)yrinic acid a,c-diamide adenosyltransferase [uncultured Secundilactobacillus sp.]|uniref:cob(I)yrinic acid a,c-diamide adenosyltransferase n=1 Tax=uncultured Secundilactobacillus sp. TaxID=2813935 RepID=UPI002585785F|nr:cob(I)yrinic acid a,c-diamide adenosyltransferase [uncultured Secundilactobacillus sp.]
MAIYTKGGDKGQTSLYDGARVDKDSTRVEAYGMFDELNANVSVAEKLCKSTANQQILRRIEYKMFFLQGEIATADTEKFLKNSVTIGEDDIMLLEQVIDQYTEELPKVSSFILPGTSLAGAQLHVCRTVCRRAERQFVRFLKTQDMRPVLEKYVNRMSDFFYILARSEDFEAQVDELVKKVSAKYDAIKGA